MLRTVKAKINKEGEVKLLEPIKVDKEKNAIVTVLDDEVDLTESSTMEMASLSEESLKEDWNSDADSRWDSVLK